MDIYSSYWYWLLVASLIIVGYFTWRMLRKENAVLRKMRVDKLIAILQTHRSIEKKKAAATELIEEYFILLTPDERTNVLILFDKNLPEPGQWVDRASNKITDAILASRL